MSDPILQIDGDVANPTQLSFDQLHALDDACRIADVSTVDPDRRGTAVSLAAVLETVRPDESATHITLHGTADGFSATLPIEAVRDVGLLIYAIDDQPLSSEAGGPIRFLIPNAAECKTAELDACSNVKFLDRIEVTGGSA